MLTDVQNMRRLKSCPKALLVGVIFAVVIYISVWWSAMLGRETRNHIDAISDMKDSLPRDFPGPLKSPVGDGSTKVLIVAYFRSGSTLTGSLFNENPEAFYLFEPLFPLYQLIIPAGQKLRYLNGSVRECPDKLQEDELVSADILSAMLTCRFEDVDVVSLTKQPMGLELNSSVEFGKCVRQNNVNEIRARCIPQYNKRCTEANYRVIKAIRVGMTAVETLLQRHPGLKVVHLLRDPRGMFCSPAFRSNCSPHSVVVEYFCRTITRDFKERQLLEEKYPSSFMEVIYEDMAADPVGRARDIYKFVGSSLPDHIAKLLSDRSHLTDNGSFGTTRKNSTETAYKWTKLIGQPMLRFINHHCSELIKHGQFPKLHTDEELRRFEIPHRPFKK